MGCLDSRINFKLGSKCACLVSGRKYNLDPGRGYFKAQELKMFSTSIQSRVRLLFILLPCLLFCSAGQAQDLAGGGTLARDIMGGASFIFRTPQNPPVGGGRLPDRRVTQLTAKERDRVIARGNAARSAPTPRYSEAEREYQQAARLDPDDARSFAGLGNVYLDQGRFADAAEQYRQAIKLKGDYVDAYMPLGYALVRMNRHADAIAAYNQALKIDPGNPEVYNNLGYLYNHTGRYGEAIEACQQAIRLLGQTGEAFKQGYQTRNEVLSHAYKNLGNAYNGLNRYDEAAVALRQATTIEPNSAAAFFNLGLTLYSGRRYSEAIEAYKQVVKLRPKLAPARFNLGLTYLAINDRNAAMAEYDTLKTLDAKMADQLYGMIKR